MVSSACCRVWQHAPALLLIPRGYRDEADDKEFNFTSRQKCERSNRYSSRRRPDLHMPMYVTGVGAQH